MNPGLIKLIEIGADITKEVIKYANDMQEQIDILNKEQIDDHNRKINNLQKKHDVILDMAMNKDASYDEKMKLLEKMDELEKEINEAIEEKNKFGNQEKEKLRAEKKKAGQVALEVVTGAIPFTTAYRAIKKKTNKKRLYGQNEIIDSPIKNDNNL